MKSNRRVLSVFLAISLVVTAWFSVFSFCSLENRELKDIKYRGLRKWAVWSLEYCRLFLIGINSIFSNCLFSAT